VTVYVIHPLRGDGSRDAFELNRLAVADLCRQIARLGHCPVSPAHAFGWLNDHNPGERATALACCLALMVRCEEAWVFGDYERSQGCQMEIAVAEQQGIQLRFLTTVALAGMKEAT
jgi:hypothetical protein